MSDEIGRAQLGQTGSAEDFAPRSMGAEPEREYVNSITPDDLPTDEECMTAANEAFALRERECADDAEFEQDRMPESAIENDNAGTR
jgi:hypothetical protein